MYGGVTGLSTVTPTIFTSIFVASTGSLQKHLHELKIFFILISLFFYLLFPYFATLSPLVSPITYK
ncbi:MAG: hypothetical protein DRP27_09685 [Thermotogae bacterium]|nr:MAG: hypothetical protein DRP27_09685 [Thermotogota bacterium]